MGGRAVHEVMKLASVKSEAKYVMVHAENGYTANVPLEDLIAAYDAFCAQA